MIKLIAKAATIVFGKVKDVIIDVKDTFMFMNTYDPSDYPHLTMLGGGDNSSDEKTIYFSGCNKLYDMGTPNCNKCLERNYCIWKK